MCLEVSHIFPKIADKDIICYKIVRKSKITKGLFLSEFRDFRYEIGKLYKNNMGISNFIVRYIIPNFANILFKRKYTIAQDMFHSYAVPYKFLYYNDNILLKCIIPKGAYYFKGRQNGICGYASSQIKILEIDLRSL